MSYSVTAAGTTYLRGTFNSSLTIASTAISLGVWFKTSTSDTENSIVALHESTGSVNNAVHIYQNTGTQLSARCIAYSNPVAGQPTGSLGAADCGFIAAGWFPAVGVWRSTTNRQIYYGLDAAAGLLGESTNDAGTGVGIVTLGVGATNGQKFTGLIAEVCIWNKELSSGEIASFCDGSTQPSTIGAANLVGYWPLNYDNSTQTNEGTDTAGDLTVTSATYDSDHPTFGGGAKNLLLLGVG